MTAAAARHGLAVAVLVALLARLATAALALPAPSRYFTVDADQYMALARAPGAGYLDPASATFAIGLSRTPGYPLLAAGLLVVGGGSVVAVIAGQILLGLGVVVLTFLLARRLFGAAAAGAAALWIALDPATTVYTCLLQPEALFTLLLLGAALAWTAALGGSTAAGLLAGGITGLLALTRPIGLWLAPILVATAWLVPESRAARTPRIACAVLGPWLLLVGGWAARNLAYTGVPTISTIVGTNLLHYRAAGALAEATGVPIEQARRDLETELAARLPDVTNPALRSQEESALAFEVLRRHPRGAIVATLRGGLKLLGGTGLTALSGLRGDPEPERVAGAAETALAGAFALLLFSLYLGAAAGAGALVRSRNFAALVVTGGIAAYFVVVSAGPEANTRFRVPAAPFLAALAGHGWTRRARR